MIILSNSGWHDKNILGIWKWRHNARTHQQIGFQGQRVKDDAFIIAEFQEASHTQEKWNQNLGCHSEECKWKMNFH